MKPLKSKRKKLIVNNPEEANELTVDDLVFTHKRYPKIIKKLGLGKVEEDYSALRYPRMRCINHSNSIQTLIYYSYAYLFFESLCFLSVTRDCIEELIQCLESDSPKQSSNFPFVSPFRGKQEYLQRIIDLLKKIVKSKKKERLIDPGLLSDITYNNPFILLSKSVLVNFQKPDDRNDFIIDLNKNKDQKSEYIEDRLIGAYKIGLRIYTIKHGELRKRIKESSFIIGKRRKILFRKKTLYIFYKVSELKCLYDGFYDIKAIAGEEESISSFGSARNYLKYLIELNRTTNENTEANHNEMLKRIEDSWKLSLGEIIKVLRLTNDTLLNEQNEEAKREDIKQITKKLEKISRDDNVRKVDSRIGETFTNLIHDLNVYNPASLIFIERKSERIEEFGKPQWTIVKGQCKECKEEKNVIQYLKNCSREVCCGIYICYECFSDKFCKLCGQLISPEEEAFLKKINEDDS